jgi:hypothetical protein
MNKLQNIKNHYKQNKKICDTLFFVLFGILQESNYFLN